MNVFQDKHRIFLTCAKGVAPFLAAEVRALGLPVIEEIDAGVETEGSGSDAMRLNLVLRTGQRVLYHLLDFTAHSAEDLYSSTWNVPWEEILLPDGYFTVTSSVFHETIRDTRFATLRCKDAVVDRMREKFGRRPNSGSEQRGAALFLFWHGRRARLFLDTSGEPLARRGYRKIPLGAPMQETLAAAVMLGTGWNGRDPFVNPMCGSGTLAIEAALIALGRAPGLLRSGYAFQHVVGFDEAAWKEMRSKARVAAARKPAGRIIATDRSFTAVEAAKQNAKTAGVDPIIEFSQCDFSETPIPEGGGAVVLNPDYGERQGELGELAELYHRIGDFLKSRCQGYLGHVFTGNLDLAKRIGLRCARRQTFFNGAIECRLLSYELYSGTRRAGPLAPAAAPPT